MHLAHVANSIRLAQRRLLEDMSHVVGAEEVAEHQKQSFMKFVEKMDALATRLEHPGL